MWSICKMLDSRFAHFTDRDSIDLRTRFVGYPEKYLTHKTYNTVFLHDYGNVAIKNLQDIPDSKWKEVNENYTRRIERFYDMLETAKSMRKTLVFLRLEPDKRQRIEYPEFKQDHAESHFLEEFSKKMKVIGVNFIVLYYTTSHESRYDEEHKICYIKYGVKDPAMILIGDHIEAIHAANGPFIKSCIQKVVSQIA